MPMLHITETRGGEDDRRTVHKKCICVSVPSLESSLSPWSSHTLGGGGQGKRTEGGGMRGGGGKGAIGVKWMIGRIREK